MYKILLVLFFLLPSGCAIHQKDSTKLARQLQTQPPEQILSILQQKKPSDTDYAQYYLNVGYLQLVSGEFESSIESFTLAKNEMQSLMATSVTENVAAGTINETFRRYSGYPTDRVMVHNMLALSYLFNQNIDGARVEMLQADIAMKSLMEDKSLIGQLGSTHLLSGIIYELLDERSNAFISYQFAEKVLSQRKIPIPSGLKFSLLRMSKKMGNEEQYVVYSQKYPDFLKRSTHDKQVFTLYFDGVVASKVEQTILVPSHDAEQLIRISVPAYPDINNNFQRAEISDTKQNMSTELIENVDLLARDDLAKEYPSILLLTTTRAIAKYEVVQKANQQGSIVGVLLNIATVLSEVADVRSWNMLPASLQFSYLETNVNEVDISTSKNPNTVVNISKSMQHVILSSSLSEQVFHYQQ